MANKAFIERDKILFGQSCALFWRISGLGCTSSVQILVLTHNKTLLYRRCGMMLR